MLIGAVLIFSSVQLEPPEEIHILKWGTPIFDVEYNIHAAYHTRWFTEAILKLTRRADC